MDPHSRGERLHKASIEQSGRIRGVLGARPETASPPLHEALIVRTRGEALAQVSRAGRGEVRHQRADASGVRAADRAWARVNHRAWLLAQREAEATRGAARLDVYA